MKCWKTFVWIAVCSLGLSPAWVQAGSLYVADHSFEQATASLKNGLLGTGIGAEYQKTIGGWQYSRGALLGLLPPNMGSYKSGLATDGDNVASIHSVAGLAGYGTIRQTLNQQFEANMRYTLSVDVSKGGLVDLLTTGPGIAITSSTAGIVASSADAALLRILDLNVCFDRWELTFVTGHDAPMGDIGIMLFTGDVLNVIGGVSFDNVSMTATAVPTPTAVLAGIGGLGLMALRRRTRAGQLPA